MKNNIIKAMIAALITIFCVACSSEKNLDDTIIIYDEDYPDLPIYSELGYNTFGAYYDRDVFISNYNQVPGKFILSDSTATFTLSGYLNNINFGNDTKNVSVVFTIPNCYPSSCSDLTTLDKKIYNVGDSAFNIAINVDGTQQEAKILSGQIEFKRAKNLLVDKVQTEVILSGYFNFKAIVNGTPITMSNGRFDIGIGEYNFFKY